MNERLSRWSILALVAALAVWLWPLGVGLRMPVGGDVTQFTLGLMAVLDDAYAALRLPRWNDRWGFGFPGLAESQMGVFYPPHIVLYGLLPLEWAYMASLVGHTLWGALGARWAARRFGAAAVPANLAGWAWGASGLFLAHLSHQWAYTVGSWMPWALGLAWGVIHSRGGPRAVLLLAGVLAIQVLPGHFQLAFITQACVLLLGVWVVIERPVGLRAALLGAGGAVAAVALVVPLAAIQLAPTWQLARQAGAGHDYAYLSGFALSPFHLVAWLSPGLGRDPLWRPLLWDPWHTSPEEVLPFIGLVPLALALGELIHGARREPAVRALGWLALGTLLLALGPYAPGFRGLIRLPGFAFFRAPARWTLATELALALLAARGLGRLLTGGWSRPGRSLGRFAGVSAVVVALLGLSVAAQLETRSGPVRTATAAAFDRLVRWPGDPGFAAVQAKALAPPQDNLVQLGLLRLGRSPGGERLGRDGRAILARELAPTFAVLAALLLLCLLVREPRRLALALGVLAVVELLGLRVAYRAVESAPLEPLVAQSPVLARLRQAPPGTRVVSDLGNLPQVAGVGAVPAYRTLDRPALGEPTRAAQRPVTALRANATAAEVARDFVAPLEALGLNLRILGPTETALAGPLVAAWPGRVETIDDPALASWLVGRRLLERTGREGGATFTLLHTARPPERARLLDQPLDALVPRLDRAPPDAFLASAGWTAAPRIETDAPRPDRLAIPVPPGTNPRTVIVQVLDDPLWRAEWVERDTRQRTPARLVPVLRGPADRAGWMAVEVPSSGEWTLHLWYDLRPLGIASGITGVALWLGLALVWRTSRHPIRRIASTLETPS